MAVVCQKDYGDMVHGSIYLISRKSASKSPTITINDNNDNSAIRNSTSKYTSNTSSLPLWGSSQPFSPLPQPKYWLGHGPAPMHRPQNFNAHRSTQPISSNAPCPWNLISQLPQSLTTSVHATVTTILRGSRKSILPSIKSPIPPEGTI